MTLDKVTKENWKQLAPELAKNAFPVDSLVAFRTWRENFGKVKGHTKSGIVVVIPGELNEVKRELSGAYRVIDYDPSTFRPQPYDRLTDHTKEIIRFTPFYSTVGDKSKVSWYRGKAGILSPLMPNDDGLIRDIQLNC